jgi:hypothetical protein
VSRILLVLAAAIAAAAVVVPSLATGAATTRPCAAADLSVRQFPTGGSGAGTIEFGVRLRNVSGAACFMKGFPGLGLRNASEARMAGFAAFDRTKTPKRVALAPGAFAHFIVRYSDIQHAGDPTPCPAPSFLLVTPPNRRVSLELRKHFRICGKGRMLVTPVAKGKS